LKSILVLTVGLALMFNVINVDHANAKDLAALSQLLRPAYIAMDYARLCAMEPQWLVTEPRGIRGSAINYAEHVKDETVKALAQEEAVIVLKAAADNALAEAREQLSTKVILIDKTKEAVKLRAWCSGYVTDFILDFINKHDSNHESFLQQIDNAIAR
jgi:hypothetical protein